jgi:hypothetical protein
MLAALSREHIASAPAWERPGARRAVNAGTMEPVVSLKGLTL